MTGADDERPTRLQFQESRARRWLRHELVEWKAVDEEPDVQVARHGGVRCEAREDLICQDLHLLGRVIRERTLTEIDRHALDVGRQRFDLDAIDPDPGLRGGGQALESPWNDRQLPFNRAAQYSWAEVPVELLRGRARQQQ